MSVEIIFKIAAIGILVTVITQLLKKSGVDYSFDFGDKYDKRVV